MPVIDGIGMEWVWVIPGLSASAFIIVTLMGRWLPGKGAAVSISAISIGFLLFWLVLIDLLKSEVGHGGFDFVWIAIGDLNITWGFLVDRLSVTMLGLITFIALVVQTYSLSYMRGDARFGWYYAIHSLFAAAMLALVLADNLLFLYIAWELVGLGSYLLIGFWYEKRSAAEAAKKAFVTTRIGDVGLLIGIILLFKATGTFNISAIFHVAEHGAVSGSVLNVSCALILLGAMGKSAQFPFHVWLPDAMEGPTPASALIHAATMVAAGIYLVARMMPLFELAPMVLAAVVIVGLFTFLFAGLMALVVRDIKRILAYSTISHLGLMMLSLGAGSLSAALLHLICHGVSKALLFLGAGSLMHSMDGETDSWKMGGLIKNMPVTGVTFVVGALSLAGVPPLGGFFSKDEVLWEIFLHLNPIVVALAFVGIVVSALYMARLTCLVFTGTSRTEKARRARESPFLMTIPLIILAICSAVVGLISLPIAGSYGGFTDFMGDGSFQLIRWITVPSVILAVCGVFVGWLIYTKNSISPSILTERFPSVYGLIVRGYYMDELYQWIIDRIIMATARFVAIFDRVVVNDTGVDTPAFSVMLSALRVRLLQTGRLNNYGMVMALGVFIFGIMLWAVGI